MDSRRSPSFAHECIRLCLASIGRIDLTDVSCNLLEGGGFCVTKGCNFFF